jgi:hypothetical protein
MSLGIFAPVLERIEQFGIQTCQASQVLGVYLICFTFVGIDEPRLAGIGYQDLVATLLEQSANPGRVSACLDGYAQWLLL